MKIKCSEDKLKSCSDKKTYSKQITRGKTLQCNSYSEHSPKILFKLFLKQITIQSMTYGLQLNISFLKEAYILVAEKCRKGKKRLPIPCHLIHMQIHYIINERFTVLLEIQPHKYSTFNSQLGSDLAALEGWRKEYQQSCLAAVRSGGRAAAIPSRKPGLALFCLFTVSTSQVRATGIQKASGE